jgi:hypothetical protein
VGTGAGSSINTANNVICIGANVTGLEASDTCFIGNIFGSAVANGSQVIIGSNNRLGTVVSSRRFKEDIRPMAEASEAILALEPVAFRYKKEIDSTSTLQFGLVAEDVEKVNPALIVRDKDGKAYSVRYDQVNAMLLNEFQKEHRKNEAQEATIARLEQQLKTIIATLQKVSAQLELNDSTPRTVLNNH